MSIVNASFHLAEHGGLEHCLFVCLVVTLYVYVLSPSALRPKRKCVHHARRPSTRWRDWLPTTWSSIQHASAASTATPNLGKCHYYFWTPLKRSNFPGWSWLYSVRSVYFMNVKYKGIIVPIISYFPIICICGL